MDGNLVVFQWKDGVDPGADPGLCARGINVAGHGYRRCGNYGRPCVI